MRFIKDRAVGPPTIQFVDKDLSFTAPGRIVGWNFFVGRAGVQRLQVWRPSGSNPYRY